MSHNVVVEDFASLSTTANIEMVTGDKVDVRTFQNTGGNKTIPNTAANARFEIFKFAEDDI